MDRFEQFSQKELCGGLAYLAFELCFLSQILFQLNQLLPVPFSGAIVNFLYFLINFCAVLLIFIHSLPALWRGFRSHIRSIAGCSLLFFFAYECAAFLMSRLITALDPQFISLNDRHIQTLLSENFPLMFLGTVLFAPVTEEFLYRGVLFRGLYDRSPAAAWILSSVLFAAVHLSGVVGNAPLVTVALCFIQYLPAGLLLAASHRLSGSLLSPILIHIAVNFAAIMALR